MGKWYLSRNFEGEVGICSVGLAGRCFRWRKVCVEVCKREFDFVGDCKCFGVVG